jgi:lincosamide nucleotidyltransferase
MLEQTLMIERSRQLCREDERVVAAMLYGSFTVGEGDRYSDIEMVLFFEDDALPQIDQRAWVAQIAPVEVYFADDAGHYTAIFETLIRGEFHFYPASKVSMVSQWGENAWFPSLEATLLIDRTGALSQHLGALIGSPPNRSTPEMVRSLSLNFINWLLFGANVLARGEPARALDLLNNAHWSLLRLIRIKEGSTLHWPTPSKGLEKDISAAAYERFKTCTARLDREQLWEAYEATWRWGQELMAELAQVYGLSVPESLIERLTQYFERLYSP